MIAAVGLSFVLIPPYGGEGAAVSLVLTSALLLVLTFRNVGGLIGRMSPVRASVAPLASGAVMGLTAVALATVAWVPAAVVAMAVYGLAFLLLERALFPRDFALYASMVRARRG